MIKRCTKILFLLLLFLPALLFAQLNDTLLSKKEARFQARFIHPKAKYVRISRGFSYMITNVVSQNEFIVGGNNQARNSNAFSVFYEHGLGNNFFIDAGYCTYSTGFILGFINGTGTYNEVIRNQQLQVGAGYRLITNKNVHLANFHFGTFYGVLQNRLTDSFFLIDPFSGVLYLNRKTNRYYYGIYAGVTKDVRLSSDVRFFVNYTQQLGFRNVFKGSIYAEATNIEFVEAGLYRVRNSGGLLTFGLKIMLFKNKYDNTSSE